MQPTHRPRSIRRIGLHAGSIARRSLVNDLGRQSNGHTSRLLEQSFRTQHSEAAPAAQSWSHIQRRKVKARTLDTLVSFSTSNKTSSG